MRIGLLSGILANSAGELGVSYPVNLEVVPVDNRIAKAQFIPTPGTEPFGSGGAPDRGGIYWNGLLYRVMGTRLVSVAPDGTTTDLGEVGGADPVRFDYSFDRLAVRSDRKLYYWNGSTLTQVADLDLGDVVDFIWLDGYFMSTDGTHVVVTDLSDPTSIQPLRYGSAEEDPDPITGLLKVRSEAAVIGRHTIQFLKNVGGNGFPFAPMKGATIPQGCVGPDAKCLFADTFAFVGSGRGEAIGVYLAGNGSATRISTRAIDDELAKVADPSTIILENRTNRAERRLLVHLPDKTLCYQLNATRQLEEDVWTVLRSGIGQPYRIRNAVEAYAGKIIVGDLLSSALGILSDTEERHFGVEPHWRFDAGLIYNEGRGGIVTKLELLGTAGSLAFGRQASAFLSMTRDGRTFTSERAVDMGAAGQNKRVQWRPRANFRQWLGLRFRGTGRPTFAALEAEILPLGA